MTHLRGIMLEELERRNYAQTTMNQPVVGRFVSAFLPFSYPEFAKEIRMRPRSHSSESRVALSPPNDLGKRLGRKDLYPLNLRWFSK